MMPSVTEHPTWRGWLHTAAFALAVPSGAVLILQTQGAMARVAAAIYVASLLALFGTSAAYHRLARSPKVRAVMRRIDHSMIYLLIAGTYVPMCLVALPLTWGIPVLSVVAGCGLIGMILKLTAFERARWVSYSLYPVMGWAIVAAGPVFIASVTPWQFVLMAAGGVLYTVGFPILLIQRPDPWPKTFGYHEVWHSFTIVAAALHFLAIRSVLV